LFTKQTFSLHVVRSMFPYTNALYLFSLSHILRETNW